MSQAIHLSSLFQAPRKPLAACVTAVFAFAAPDLCIASNTWTVTSCRDSGPGTLRDIVGAPGTLSGDTIDLSKLTGASDGCGLGFAAATISLQTGAIHIAQADLTLEGAGSDQLLIQRPRNHMANGYYYFYAYDRILTHSGTGNLHVNALSISGGYLLGSNNSTTKGGCIYSAGNLTLDHVTADSCQAVGTQNGNAYGGATYTKGGTTLSTSTLVHNGAGVIAAGNVRGGAIFSLGDVALTNSVISYNTATGVAGGKTYNATVTGGAVYAKAGVTLNNSTLAHNSTEIGAPLKAYYFPGGTAAGGAILSEGSLISNVSALTHNSATGTYAYGGAIWADGDVTLTGDTLTYNASTALNLASGGGILAKGNLTLSNVMLSHNVASSGGLSKVAYGGGAVSIGAFSATNSIIGANTASGGFGSGKYSFAFSKATRAGGVYAKGGATISGSTLSSNSASFFAGGLLIANPPTTITNSTISGNQAAVVGGAYMPLPVTIQNTTIVFNTASVAELAVSKGNYFPVAVGLGVSGSGKSANLHSTLISNNIANSVSTFTGSAEDDFGTFGTTPVFSAANNLIRVSSAANLLPADTIKVSCPLLGPLRDNGGPTPTHALLSHSPAIDTGNNAALLTSDQRGLPYVRTSGMGADIGAYEVQQGDIVFNTGFEGCL